MRVHPALQWEGSSHECTRPTGNCGRASWAALVGPPFGVLWTDVLACTLDYSYRPFNGRVGWQMTARESSLARELYRLARHQSCKVHDP